MWYEDFCFQTAMRTWHDAVCLGKFIRVEFNVAAAMLTITNNVAWRKWIAWLVHGFKLLKFKRHLPHPTNPKRLAR
jgi:hypothetical protein